MNLVTKVFIPAAIAFAAFGAQAASSGQIPGYGHDAQAVASGAAVGAATSVAGFVGQEAFSRAFESTTMRSRDEVRSEASGTRAKNPDHVA